MIVVFGQPAVDFRIDLATGPLFSIIEPIAWRRGAKGRDANDEAVKIADRAGPGFKCGRDRLVVE
ncbi:MAG: hypothetical protein WCA28_04245 [Bradyrhizobium sp.]